MIQRIQSLFLLLVTVCMGLAASLPLWQKTDPQGTQQFTVTALGLTHTRAGKVIYQEPLYHLIIIASVAAIVAFVSLFAYKNRLNQIKLNLLNSLLMATLLVITVLKVLEAEELFNADVKGNPAVGFYAMILGLIFNALANRFIRRDEQLVRSADRLR